MTTEHNVIVDPEIHEPKDVSTATIGQAYVSDGAGSGDWTNIAGANFKVVNSLADLPTPAGGIITLVDNTVYFFSAAISTTDRFILGANNVITSNNIHAPAITYTGTGDMFTGVDKSVTFRDCTLSCASARVFNISDTTGGVRACLIENVVIAAATSFGIFDDLRTLNVTSSGTAAIAQGIVTTGSNWSIIAVTRTALISASATFVGVDLGSTVSTGYDFEQLVVVAPSGAIGIKGVAASANVAVGSIGTVARSTFIGGLTSPLSGITEDDIRWNLQGNSANVEDTMPDSLISLTGNAVETVLAVGVPSIVAGTWVDERSSQYTNTTAGRATYNGERDITTPIDISIVVDMASGTNKSMRAYVAINGSVVTNSGKAVNISAGDPKELSIPWQEVLSTTDFVEVFIENETDSVNATVIDATIRVR